MARVVHYDGFDAGPEVAAGRPALYRDPWYAWGQADVLTSMTEGTLQMADASVAKVYGTEFFLELYRLLGEIVVFTHAREVREYEVSEIR